MTAAAAHGPRGTRRRRRRLAARAAGRGVHHRLSGVARRDRPLHGIRRRPGRLHDRPHRRVPVDLADARGVRQQPGGGAGIGRVRDAHRRSARLPHRAIRVPRRRAGADAGRAAAGDAAVRRRGGAAAPVRPQRLDQPAARRGLRHPHPVHGRIERRHLRRGAALLSVHPAQSRRRAREHRRRDGGGGAESRQPRVPAVPPRRVPARRAGLRRGRRAGVRQGVRRSGHAARAQRHQHAGAAGLPAHHVGRARGSDRLRDRAGDDRVLDRRARALRADHQGARLRDTHARRNGLAQTAARRRERGARVRLGAAGAGAGALAAPRPAAAVTREGMELLGAARKGSRCSISPSCSPIPAG